MTKEDIVKGLAKWIRVNVTPLLTKGGLLKAGMLASLRLAEANPRAGLALLAMKFPMIEPLVSMVSDDKSFDAFVDMMKGIAMEEGGIVIQFSEVGLFNCTPHSIRITAERIEEMAKEVRNTAKTVEVAQTKEDETK